MRKKLASLLANLTLVILSSFFTLLALEGLSRHYMRSELTHVVDAAGRIVSMQIDPGRPEEGLRPHFKGRMKSGEFDVPVVLDERGFRIPIISGSEFSGPAFRVTLLGDSFMFGWGAPPDSGFAGSLARDLSRLLERPVCIRNLSVPGTGQVAQLNLLRESREQEDVIVAGLYLSNHVASGNDLLDNLNERYRASNADTTHPRLISQKQQVDFLRRVRRKLKQESNLYRLLEARLGSLFLAKLSGAMRVGEDKELMETAWQIEDSLLVELKREADRRKAVLILQYFPNMLDFAQESRETYTRLLGLAGRHDIAVAPSPIELLRQSHPTATAGDFYYLVDGHWRPRAHQIAAARMAELIVAGLEL